MGLTIVDSTKVFDPEVQDINLVIIIGNIGEVKSQFRIARKSKFLMGFKQ